MPKFKAGAVSAAMKNEGALDTAAAPDTFTLVLKSVATLGWDLNQLQQAGDKAGLEWSRVSTPSSDKHVPGERRSEPVAAFVYQRTGEYSFGKRQQEVRFTMDLHAHSAQGNALLVMRRAAEVMADALGANIFLENGIPASDKALEDASAQISIIHRSRREAVETIIPMDDGTVRKPHDLVPWRSTTETAKGRVIAFNKFDVQPETYYRGVGRGEALMLEMLSNLKELTEPRRHHLGIAEAFAEAADGSWKDAVKVRGRSRANVAAGMAAVVEEALVYFARNANFDRWLKERIAQSDRMAQHDEAEQAVERQERLVRAKIAHANKRKGQAVQPAPKVPLAQKISAVSARKAVAA